VKLQEVTTIEVKSSATDSKRHSRFSLVRINPPRSCWRRAGNKFRSSTLHSVTLIHFLFALLALIVASALHPTGMSKPTTSLSTGLRSDRDTSDARRYAFRGPEFQTPNRYLVYRRFPRHNKWQGSQPVTLAATAGADVNQEPHSVSIALWSD